MAGVPLRVYVMPVAEWLKCAVCLDVLAEPVSLLVCGHTFCSACVAPILAKPAAQRKCPNCRAGVAANIATNWNVKEAIGALRVRCRFGVKEEGDGWVADEAGCSAQLSLDGAAAHEAECGFAVITCPFAGCGVALRRNQANAHDATFAVAHARGERAARIGWRGDVSCRIASPGGVYCRGRVPFRGLGGVGCFNVDG